MKSLPHVTPLCLQSQTTIHTKIHACALVHKSPPRKPAISLSLQFLHTSIISKHTHFVTSFIKTPHFSEHMTTPRDFTKNTGWGRANNKKYPHDFFASPLNKNRHTSTLQLHSKQLKPSQASLLDLLPKYILTDIEIWISVLENDDKLKGVVLRIKNVCNPIIFAISHDLWTAYHNFGVFHWYNE